MTAILVLHAVSTTALFGLIWFVQVVHYPLFHGVGAREFTSYEIEHQRRTTWVVAPLMCVEAITAIALVLMVDGGTQQVLALVGVLLVASIWLLTAFIQVPCHRKLAAGYDAAVTKRLVTTNWLRTIAWTCRVPVAILFAQGGVT